MGAVPLGFITYATNVIERRHRHIKDQLPNGYQHFNVAEIMIEVCDIISPQITKGYYDRMVNEISEPWKVLEKLPFRRNSARDEEFTVLKPGESGTEEKSQQKRLDFAALNEHFKKNLAEKTYLVKPCSLTLSTGEEAKLAYVFPKYRLNYAVEKPVDMHAMMNLALA